MAQSTNTPNPLPKLEACTSGETVAHMLGISFPVVWELDPTTGTTTAHTTDGAAESSKLIAGRVIESVPGELYFFQDHEEAKRKEAWGDFDTAAEAAEKGAVRFMLRVNGYPIPFLPEP